MKKDNINVKRMTIGELLSNNFLVPGYQRPYEWKSEQIKSLLVGICEAKKVSNADIYLLGTMQFTEKIIKEKTVLEIIDGHQRITTLFLMLMALDDEKKEKDEENRDFTFKNEINGAENFESLFAKESIYQTNLNYIRDYLNDIECDEKKELISYIKNQLIIIDITIKDSEEANEVSIEDTLSIFNTLNTTGLKLQAKDIFKIKFAEYLKKKNPDIFSGGLFKSINEAYQKILDPIDSPNANEIYDLSEDDLLDSYRFYLMSNLNLKKWANDFKKTNVMFFDELFQKDSNVNIDLDDFCKLAECIKQTQCCLEKRDNSVVEKDKVVFAYSKELLAWSGYSRIKNLYYYVIFSVFSEKVDEQIINFADRVINSVWRYCSVFRFVKSQIINEVFNTVGEILFGILKTESSYEEKAISIEKEFQKSIEQKISDNDNYFVLFQTAFSPNGNAFESNRIHLLMFLSYIHDTIDLEDPPCIVETKEKIAYWKNKGIDIEHILSRSLYNENDDVFQSINAIGNLMYLYRKQNRWLGDRLAKNKDRDKKQDFSLKVSTYQDCQNELASVKAFVKEYSNNFDFIKERNREKIQFLKDVYNYEVLFKE